MAKEYLLVKKIRAKETFPYSTEHRAKWLSVNTGKVLVLFREYFSVHQAIASLKNKT